MSAAASLVFRSVVSPSNNVASCRVSPSIRNDRPTVETGGCAISLVVPHNSRTRNKLSTANICSSHWQHSNALSFSKIHSTLTAFYIPDTNRCYTSVSALLLNYSLRDRSGSLLRAHSDLQHNITCLLHRGSTSKIRVSYRPHSST